LFISCFTVHRVAGACGHERALDRGTQFDIDRKNRSAFVAADKQKRNVGPVQHLSYEDQILDLCLMRGQAGFQAGDLSSSGNNDGFDGATDGPTTRARLHLGHRNTAFTK
jgi:hypothetical protein